MGNGISSCTCAGGILVITTSRPNSSKSDHACPTPGSEPASGRSTAHQEAVTWEADWSSTELKAIRNCIDATISEDDDDDDDDDDDLGSASDLCRRDEQTSSLIHGQLNPGYPIASGNDKWTVTVPIGRTGQENRPDIPTVADSPLNVPDDAGDSDYDDHNDLPPVDDTNARNIRPGRQLRRYQHEGAVSSFLTLGQNGPRAARLPNRSSWSMRVRTIKDDETSWKSLCDTAIPVERSMSMRIVRPVNSAVTSVSKWSDATYDEILNPKKYATKEDFYTSDVDSLLTEELGSDIAEDLSGSRNSLNTMTSGKGTSIDSQVSPGPYPHSIYPESQFGSDRSDSVANSQYRPKAAGRHRSAPFQVKAS